MICPILKYKSTEEDYIFKRKFNKSLDVVVSKDDIVKRDAIMATGEVAEVKSRVDLAAALKVKAKDVSKYVLCIQGERINRGDPVAYRRGRVMKREIRIQAPSSGVVNLNQIKEGILKILDFASESTVSVGVGGKIVSVIRNKHVSIKTKVMKIHPFEVLGRSVQGEIVFLKNENPSNSISLSGSLVVVERPNIDISLLREIEMKGAKGVIIGGLSFNAYQKFRKIASSYFALCLMEGFGNLTINPKVLPLLKKNDGYMAELDSKNNELVLTYVQREVVEEKDKLVTRLRRKMLVKIVDDNFWGEYGQVMEIIGEYAKVQIAKNRIIDINVNNLFVIL
ncbi:MAG: hypothetical protein PHS44_03205 [Candidatus Dojkabacteria bacterium]|nr:hypothetical protein [Candidatus Dojkabacteria bacterium]